jgi:malonate transporter MadL subunit|tara:strand:+ start:87 stop:260 length:174 start_codon:yes stop_codon:yes gene_type:complete
MYIPIVIAMAAKQNVIAAVSSGPMALLAGVAAVTVSFLAIPLIARWGSGAVEDAEQA